MVYIVLNPVLTFHVKFALSTVTKKEKIKCWISDQLQTCLGFMGHF